MLAGLFFWFHITLSSQTLFTLTPSPRPEICIKFSLVYREVYVLQTRTSHHYGVRYILFFYDSVKYTPIQKIFEITFMDLNKIYALRQVPVFLYSKPCW
jgi:hypothetical protein